MCLFLFPSYRYTCNATRRRRAAKPSLNASGPGSTIRFVQLVTSFNDLRVTRARQLFEAGANNRYLARRIFICEIAGNY